MFWDFFYEFFSLKGDVSVPSKSDEQINIFFVGILTLRKE